jgi:predicted GNAT family acetyltransferase
MDIKHQNTEKNGVFYVEELNNRLAEMTYVWSGPDKFIIDHTEVSEKLKGLGIGNKLVLAAVEYARKNNVKIMPLCPFAKKVFERNEAYKDVLF